MVDNAQQAKIIYNYIYPPEDDNPFAETYVRGLKYILHTLCQ
jgi:hypothetical protein